MASKTFEIRTEPHEAVLGDVKLYFVPEVGGAAFATAYAALREVQKKVGASEGSKSSSTKHAKEAKDLDPAVLGEISEALHTFVRQFLVPASRELFDGMGLPDRVLVQLMEWVAELYGGGSGNPEDAGGTSTG